MEAVATTAATAVIDYLFTAGFRAATGSSPAVWRRRARLLASLPMLRTATVTETAGRLGYATPAAFTAEFGTPPSRIRTA